ncbi:MAG: DMT family transporter [Parafannyhessea umbonata]|uniref:DMT family transporter n=1 Tax=Parafannyhessea umbonata TaxID=604330 RepID=UPI0026F302D5|nr:DMT family transporter [Parafannyhessea umbonata]MDD6565429.1 DMT family transporter [Parafannyhessea umbonata]
MDKASGAGIGAGWTQRQADLMIAVIACAWGSSYLMMQVGLSSIPPFGMVALRFGIAFVAVAVIFRKRLRELTASVVARGAVLGFLLCVFFGLLMYGLKTTPASTAGFLTSAKVIFVPLIVAVATHREPSRATLAGIGICVAGLALLTLNGPVSLGGGAGLCLAGSAVYALQIVATDTFSRSDDALLLGICQLGFAAVFGAAFNLAFEGPTLPQSPAEWGAVLGLALVCSAFGFAMQPVAQSRTTATHAGLLFSLESVSSAVLSFVFLGEVMAPQCYLGCALILAAVLLSSLADGKADAAEGAADAHAFSASTHGGLARGLATARVHAKRAQG